MSPVGDRDWYVARTPAALAAALRSAREATGLTQQELAERLKVHRVTVLDAEAGRTPAFERLLRQIAAVGYDIVLVPRGSRVSIEASSAEPGG